MERSVSTLFYFLPAGENGSSRCQTASTIPFIQHAWQRSKGRAADDCLVLIHCGPRAILPNAVPNAEMPFRAVFWADFR